MRRIVIATGAGLGVLLVYLGFWPVPIDPVSWEPPHYDAQRWRPTGDLRRAERTTLSEGHGPEDVDRDREGRIVAGLEDGSILSWDDLGAAPQLVANTGGRPLGLHVDAEGRLLVADARRGLLRVERNGELETLATACGERDLVFTDDLETSQDGTVYFTDASVKFGIEDWKDDILESEGNGRLCRWREGETRATELLDKLHFANGVAVSHDQRSVLVVETSRYQVLRVWIDSERQGEVEVLIDNLPGFPDGISAGTDGLYWVAIASPRNALLDGLAGSPWLRRIVFRLPEFLKPKPEHTARVLGIDDSGAVHHDLFDPTGAAIAVVTSVQERDGFLYLGSLSDRGFAVVQRPMRASTEPKL
ncbi:MAG: SMP-30/gluconolactonase/LRE family protein [Myxococcota bacterium]